MTDDAGQVEANKCYLAMCLINSDTDIKAKIPCLFAVHRGQTTSCKGQTQKTWPCWWLVTLLGEWMRIISARTLPH